MFVQVTKAVLGYRKTGSARVEMHEPGSILEIRDEDAPRLIELGAVIPVNKEGRAGGAQRPGSVPATEKPSGNPSMDEKAPETPENADYDSMSFSELKEIAKAKGVYNGTMKSRSAVLEALRDDPPAYGALDVIEE